MTTKQSSNGGCLQVVLAIVAISIVLWIVSWIWPALLALGVIAGGVWVARRLGVSGQAAAALLGAGALVAMFGVWGQVGWVKSRSTPTIDISTASGPADGADAPQDRARPEDVLPRVSTTSKPTTTRAPRMTTSIKPTIEPLTTLAPRPPPTTATSTTLPPTVMTVPATTAAPPPPTTIAVPTTAAASGCHPSYTPCVPIASDADCSSGSSNGPVYVYGPVRVVGPDVYDLDRDGDGIGCEDG